MSDRARSVEGPKRLPIGRELEPLGPPAAPARGSFARMLRFERRWLVTVFEALLPSKIDPRLPLGAADVPMGRFVDDLLARAPLEFVVGLRLVLWLVVLAPLVVLRRARTFMGLAPHEQLVVLDRLRTSDLYVLREAPILLKTIACLAFGGLPQVQASIGIDPIDDVPPTWARKHGSGS